MCVCIYGSRLYVCPWVKSGWTQLRIVVIVYLFFSLKTRFNRQDHAVYFSPCSIEDALIELHMPNFFFDAQREKFKTNKTWRLRQHSHVDGTTQCRVPGYMYTWVHQWNRSAFWSFESQEKPPRFWPYSCLTILFNDIFFFSGFFSSYRFLSYPIAKCCHHRNMREWFVDLDWSLYGVRPQRILGGAR